MFGKVRDVTHADALAQLLEPAVASALAGVVVFAAAAGTAERGVKGEAPTRRDTDTG